MTHWNDMSPEERARLQAERQAERREQEARMDKRIPIVREDSDGTITDGTARVSRGGRQIDDFRDLDGEPLDLPPGSSYLIDTELPPTIESSWDDV